MKHPVATIRPVKVSNHFQYRAAQRGLRRDQLIAAVAHGKRYYLNGALFIVLRRRDVPSELQSMLARYEGVTIVASADGGSFITCYKNPEVLRLLRRRERHAIPPHARAIMTELSGLELTKGGE